ncbi:MAG: AAA family ATPase [Roseburia sp.]
MIYLQTFTFPTAEQESSFHFRLKRTCYDTLYPFGILSKHHFQRIDFEPITILYGGNGTGKSTALNIIAEKTGLTREAVFNQSNFYGDYLRFCEYSAIPAIPANSRIITSDDVFDYMLTLRNLNLGIDRKREDLFEEYLANKYSGFQFRTMSDIEKLRKVNKARSKTQSGYVRSELMDNVREYSNGESAHRYFVEKIAGNALYLLDEPENSLSPERQLELVSFLEDSARFFGCQFVISTHSPFLLSLRGAKIYDLDEDPVDVKPWTSLQNVRVYYHFFKRHEKDFD